MRSSPAFLLTFLLAACEIGGDAPTNDTLEPPDEQDTDTDSDADSDTDSDADSDADADADADSDADSDADTDTSAYDRCFADIAAQTHEPAPDYTQFDPTIAEHCQGTNHQDITGVERVVFLGDSVTVGTPPTAQEEFYRNILALALAERFGLDEPDWIWQGYDPFNGTTWYQDSGDFSLCAEWGARADDLMRDDDQVERCLPESERDKVTLVVMTVGGNDLNSLTEGFMEDESIESLWAETEEFMGLVRDTVEWIKEPERFPNGVHVILTNLYEFTDATGDVTACPLAELAGYGEAVTDPELAWMVVHAMEEFMSIAVDTDTDMLFLLETFCGHGFNYDDASGRCYRGDDAELWFDMTCIHPNAIGHAKIAEMFEAVVDE